MSFSSWRGVVGMVNPTMRPGMTEEVCRLLPEGIGLIPLFLNIRRGTEDEFETMMPHYEKLIALRFPELCPPTYVGAGLTDLRDFVARVGTAVVKPVDGFAGLDVWLVGDDHAAIALLESATHGGRRQVIAQQYLPAVEHGNK